MLKLSTKKASRILMVLGVLMVLGGLIRILAGKNTFEIVYMGHLWSDHPYFIYIYKMLGAFVLIIGVTFIVISTNTYKYQSLIKTWRYLFLMIGIVLIGAGIYSGIHLFFYIPDCVFFFLLSFLLFITPVSAK